MVPGAASRSDVTQLKVSQRRSPLVSGGYWQIALAHPHARRAESGLSLRASPTASVRSATRICSDLRASTFCRSCICYLDGRRPSRSLDGLECCRYDVTYRPDHVVCPFMSRQNAEMIKPIDSNERPFRGQFRQFLLHFCP